MSQTASAPGLRHVRPPPTLRSRVVNVLEFEVVPGKFDPAAGLGTLEVEPCQGDLAPDRVYLVGDDDSALEAKFEPPAADGTLPIAGTSRVVGSVIDTIDDPARYYEELSVALPKLGAADGQPARTAFELMEWSTPPSSLAGLGPTQRAQLYFADLDRRTEPRLAQAMSRFAPREPRVPSYVIDGLMGCLTEELELRRAVAKPDSAGDPPRLVHRLDTFGKGRHAETVGTVFMQLLDKYFPAAEGGLDLVGVRDAYVQFARGDLRIALQSGAVCCQPSSGWFFLFGELAIFAHRCGLERPTDWLQLARIMVGCQEIFAEVYRPLDGAPPFAFGEYWGANFDSSRVADFKSVKVLKDLQDKYATSQFDKVRWDAARNAKKYVLRAG